MKFIPKPGKDRYDQAKSFCPISLSSYTFKVLERVVLRELEHKYLSRCPLNKNQHAFRTGSSCDTALSSMVGDIEKATLRGQYAMVAYLDISGAFDNLDPDAAIRGMRRKKFPNLIIDWYAHYLRRRRVTTTVKGITRDRYLTTGTPQGGVLSPLMWNVGFDELLDLYDEGPVKIKGFADDAGLIVTGIDPVLMANILEQGIKKATDWGAENHLTFGAAKTVIVLYTKKRKKVEIPPIKVCGVDVELSTSAKYLGVILDKKLNFNEHIDAVTKKAKAVLAKIKGSIGKLWGPSPNLMKWVYTGMVRPILTYGSVVWAHRLTLTQLRKLNKVQRLGMLSLTYVKRSTPTLGLEVAYDIPPLAEYLRARAVMTMERVTKRNGTTWDGIGQNNHRGHIFLAQKSKRSLGMGEVTLTPPIDEDNFVTNFTVNTASFEYGEPPGAGELPGWLQVYTDGSQIDGATGWGYHVVDPPNDPKDGSGRLSEGATVFQAEVTAIQKAAESLLETQHEQIAFFVDSQAALKAIIKQTIDSTLVAECVNTLNTLGGQKRVSLNWIKAHVGHEHNEAVDALAKQGTTEEVQEGEGFSLPPSFYKRRLKESMYESWEKEWRRESTCRQTRCFLPSPDPTFSKHLLRLGRDKLSLAVQALTGHNNLNYHRFNMEKSDTDLCRLCGEHREEAWILLTECPALAATRQTLDINITGSGTLSVDQLLGLLSEGHISKLFAHREE